jgi:hypothetical protein
MSNENDEQYFEELYWYHAWLLEAQIVKYHWELLPEEWERWRDEYNSLEEAFCRGCYTHEPWFPGEE